MAIAYAKNFISWYNGTLLCVLLQYRSEYASAPQSLSGVELVYGLIEFG